MKEKQNQEYINNGSVKKIFTVLHKKHKRENSPTESYKNKKKKVMKVNGKMIKEKGKELLIMIMVIDMKVILAIGREKEKGFIIILMVIKKWVIIQMMNQ